MTQAPMPIDSIAVLGCGNMGGAIIVGFVKRIGIASTRVIACDKQADRLAVIGQELGCETTTDPAHATRRADVLILAVKPKDVSTALEEIVPAYTERKSPPLVVSVVGGLRVRDVRAKLGADARVVRVMPNIACMVGLGLSAMYGDAEDDRTRVEQLFRGVGDTIAVEREDDLDIATGLCASAPAFIFQVIEALADGGVKMGLPRETALTMAAKMVRGAAGMVVETELHPAKLKDMVASPAGTTIAGLHVLERNGVRGTFISAVEAAVQRAREMHPTK